MVNELLLKHYQAGKFGIPIALPNHTFKPNGYPMWAKWQLMPTNAYKGNFRETEQAGLLQITLFVPAGTKTDAIERKAQDIVNWFGVEVQHSVQMTDFKDLLFASTSRYADKLRYARNPTFKDLTIMSSIAKDAMPDGEGYYMQPIVIAYQVI